ncbi:MAG: hypothetical protein PHO71_08685 [Bacteroides sp.]|nr:hypothetical protein [Bacteroides sp.]MDD3037940.1 hypothetical protein [Bacteroides sp.]
MDRPCAETEGATFGIRIRSAFTGGTPAQSGGVYLCCFRRTLIRPVGYRNIPFRPARSASARLEENDGCRL